jgi:hypothetical protein
MLGLQGLPVPEPLLGVGVDGGESQRPEDVPARVPTSPGWCPRPGCGSVRAGGAPLGTTGGARPSHELPPCAEVIKRRSADRSHCGAAAAETAAIRRTEAQTFPAARRLSLTDPLESAACFRYGERRRRLT